MTGKLMWQQSLVEKYNISGPRYTSYPTALQFFPTQDKSLLELEVEQLPLDQPISIYIHIPFCDVVCFYCACNKVVTKDKSKANKYLEFLFKEIDQWAELIGNRPVFQMHWGGGTPTFINAEQTTALNKKLRSSFNFVEENAEISIELDPRKVDEPKIANLASNGFNRISIGVQDFNLDVQKAVNRIQSEQETREVINHCRSHGFKSINIDLIYGLPKQTEQSFQDTVEAIIDIRPNRISVFNYAHLPHRFKPQRRINDDELPDPAVKLNILHQTIDQLVEAGYVYIGMDHFALPDDELTLAQKNGSLKRNFQGYTTHGNTALVGLGVSAISQINQYYSQNHSELESYYTALESDQRPWWRGCQSNLDDKIRHRVIMQLISNFYCSFAEIEAEFDIDFLQYFSAEIKKLAEFEKDGLIQATEKRIQVLEPGRLFIRNVCMVFDAYIKQFGDIARFSKVI
jgi:oxygen-independent coproporphyrinogen III oxidase